MKISTKGRYALRMLYDLALNGNENYVSLKDIAERQNISKKYLEQIIPLIGKDGILKANRGNKGGYMLAKYDKRSIKNNSSAEYGQSNAEAIRNRPTSKEAAAQSVQRLLSFLTPGCPRRPR